MSNYKYYATTFAMIELLHSLKKQNIQIDKITFLIEHLVSSLKVKDSDNESIDLIANFLIELAKGPDGVLGTDDDLIPKHIVDDIKLMKDTSIMKDIIALCTKKNKRKWYHIYLVCMKCMY